MKRRAPQILLLIGVLTMAPVSVDAGRLDQSNISTERKWQPDACHRPVAPSTKVYDLVTYNVAVSMFNTYRGEVSAYFTCAGAEAEQDYEAFRKILADSLDYLQGEVMSQFKGLKSDLELSRKAFE
jgi:hypothetical protein